MQAATATTDRPSLAPGARLGPYEIAARIRSPGFRRGELGRHEPACAAAGRPALLVDDAGPRGVRARIALSVSSRQGRLMNLTSVTDRDRAALAEFRRRVRDALGANLLDLRLFGQKGQRRRRARLRPRPPGCGSARVPRHVRPRSRFGDCRWVNASSTRIRAVTRTATSPAPSASAGAGIRPSREALAGGGQDRVARREVAATFRLRFEDLKAEASARR